MRVKREKPFICGDCDLADHPRLLACADPAGCLGLWYALTAYARLHLTDGFVPKRYAETKWGDPTNGARLEDMIRNGLLASHPSTYEVLRYSPRNQTKADVLAARESARLRKRKQRAEEAANENVTVGVTRDNRVSHASVSTSTSSLILPSDHNLKSKPLGAGGAGDEIPAWARDAHATESQLGLQADLDSAWKKYKGHRADTGRHLTQDGFTGWLAEERVRERKARERARDGAARAQSPADIGYARPPPEFKDYKPPEGGVAPPPDDFMDAVTKIGRKSA